MIKVVEVSSDSNIGGAGKCILTFLRSYDRSKFDVSVIIPVGSKLKPEIKALGTRVYELEDLAEKSLDLKAVSKLKRLFKQIRPDIVHTHASMSARLAAKQCGIKTVYTRHSVFPPPAKISKGVGKLINGFINNHTADRIIAVAEAAKDNLTATGVDEKKIEVVLNGVDALKPFDAERLSKAKEKYGIRPGQKTAAIVARLNKVKGHKYFVEAAEIIKERGLDMKFLIAGTGETEDEIRSLIKEKGLEDTVVMLGFLNDVEPLMNVMDIQVNCSFGTEATSLSLLEGMSLGKPAVVTDFGGNPGVIKDGVNGYLVPTHDSKALADRIEKLASDDELYSRISQNCFEIYAKTFTSEANARKIEEIYNQLYKSIKNNGGNSR
ncbi:MAG TPA: glycosyltransferase family 4 protein [Firmicutes bacterium]|nr:glycosyltransferase family 4 protein [Bacillota bacterium]